MTNDLYVGIGPPNVSFYEVERGDTRVNAAGADVLADLTDVTSAVWEVRGPTSMATWPVDIRSQTADALRTMRTHRVTDFPAEGQYDVRVRLYLPGGSLFTDWTPVRVRRLPCP